MTAKKVTTIPATINKFTAAPVNSRKKRRVAGYARVSTDHDDQTTRHRLIITQTILIAEMIGSL